MLHVSNNDIIDKDKISRCLQSLQSTSPSPLLLASLDATTTQLKEHSASIFDNAINLAMEARNTIKQILGITIFDFPNMDPLRITFGVFDLGVSGYEADDFLYMNQKIISELSTQKYLTLVIPPGTCREHIDRLILGFKHLSLSSSFIQHQRKKEIKHVDINFNLWNDIDMQLTPREAFFARKKKVDVKDAVGKVCGELICPYPPGIPIRELKFSRSVTERPFCNGFWICRSAKSRYGTP
ncbi:hypothetical protein BVRB_8g186560 [Beta vulgaris subsp. vulgaris]|uniref:Uncharacterized protein n=1 Tax=Beta vulgaris subsp. vulgaris TaxID=3555 RepID=A0A0J8BVX4_BETVV|nr:hypothetical protein BVRB_8g186560 [Beta vulgaris subsp. vulgaris]